MLTGIVGFEWRYATRRISFALAAALLALMGFALGATGFGSDDIHVNAPYAVAHATGFLSLVSVFALTVLVAPAVLKDTEHHMAEIVYATAVTKTQYLLGRFAGSLLAASTAFAFGMLGLALGALRHEPARLGPFDLVHYLWPFVILGLPTLLFVGAFLFAVAALTRSALATYVAGAIVYVLYLVTALLTNSPLLASSGPTTTAEMAFAALVDPFAISAFFEQTHYWTAAERGVLRLGLTGPLLVNRLLWAGAAALIMALTHRLFAFRVATPSHHAEDVEDASPVPRSDYRPVAVERVAAWPAILSATRMEIRTLRRSWPFAALLVLWVGSAGIELSENVRSAEFGTALLPTTGLLIGHLGRPLLLFGLLLLVYFTAELVWRERTVGVAEVVDATPASSAVFLVSKAAALSTMVGLLIAVAIVVGVLFQLVHGYRDFEPALYLSLFYFSGLPLVLFAMLALLVQTLSPNRHAGMLLTLVAALFLPLGAPGGPDHPLLRFATGVPVPYSAMNGFSPAAVSFAAFMAYWSALAGLLAFATYGLWRRGTDARLLPRIGAMPRRVGRPARLAALGGGILFTALGGVLYRQTNIVNAYETPEERAAWKAAYERAYGAVERMPQPEIAHIRAEVDLFPEEQRFRVRGRYRLENRTGETLRKVWASVRRDIRSATLTLDGRPPARVDAAFRMLTFDVDMAPGAQAEFGFDVTLDRRGVTASPAHDVVQNGTFVLGPMFQPALGYRRGYQLEDRDERRRHGLGDPTTPPHREPDLTTYELVISTPADQIVVAPGVLRETWEKDGRRFARFVAERPVQPILAFASARYAVERSRHGAVDVEVLHHPAHRGNVGRILEAATRSLDYFGKHFGPYPYPALRIAEIPAYDDRFAGFALPGVFYFTEDRGFLTDTRDERRIDIVTKRTAHEIAHQWWGHQVVPPDGPGASAVVETLARYSELLILKERYGAEALRPVLQVELDRYLSGRTGEAEVPLDRADDEGYLSYAKGALVMMALHDLIGEEGVNGALRSLLAQSASGGRAPTAADLVEALRRATPVEQRHLVDEWLSQVVLYDLRVVSAKAHPLPDGRYRVEARIEASRSAVGDGAETPLPMHEALDVAVYAEDPSAGRPPLSMERHLIEGPTSLSVVVEGKPAYVAIDPMVRRIDRNPDDNLKPVAN